MRLIHYYLIGYFLVIVGATLALWKAGILTHIAPMWLFIAALVVIGLGLLVAVTATRPAIREI